MTTHFTSGVTNVKADGTGGRLKTMDPIKYHMYHNDFDKFVAADFTITTTEAGTGSATETVATGDGGLLVITNAAGDDTRPELLKTINTKQLKTCFFLQE